MPSARLTFAACGFVVALAAARSAIPAAHGGDAWFDHRSSGAIVCRANFSLAEHEELFAELAQLQIDVRRMLELEKSREAVELYLFKNEREYRSYLQTYLPEIPYRRALFIKTGGPGRVYAYQGRDLDTDVRHESTHGLLHASLPAVPLWLDEGLAEYFEVPAEQRANGNPHEMSVVWRLRLGSAPRLARLEQKSDISEMSTADYRDAWAWVHFMLHGPPEAHDELVRFLADLRAQRPAGQLSERLERRLPGVDQRLAQHFKKVSH